MDLPGNLIFLDELPHNCSQGYTYIKIGSKRFLKQRLIIQFVLGRELLKSEVVHFKDGNRKNFKITNLVVVDIKKQTKLLFDEAFSGRYKKLPLWSIDYPCCLHCETTKHKYAGYGLCMNCYKIQYNKLITKRKKINFD